MLDLVERAEPGLTGPDSGRWLNEFEACHDDIRAALQFGIDNGHHSTALRLAIATAPFWFRQGHANEGRAWLEQALADNAAVSTESRIRGFDLARRSGVLWPPRRFQGAPSVREKLSIWPGRGQQPRSRVDGACRLGQHPHPPRSGRGGWGPLTAPRSNSAARPGSWARWPTRSPTWARSKAGAGRYAEGGRLSLKQPEIAADAVARPEACHLDHPDARRVGNRTGEI